MSLKPAKFAQIEYELSRAAISSRAPDSIWLAETLNLLQPEIPALKTLAQQNIAYNLALLFKFKISPYLKKRLFISLELFSHPKAVRFILNAWKNTRSPELEELIRQKRWNLKEIPFYSATDSEVNVYLAFKFGYKELLEKPDARLVRTAINIALDPLEPELTEAARAWLEKLDNRTLLDTVAAVWAQRKAESLLNLLIKKQHFSKKIEPARIAVALHRGDWQALAADGPSTVLLIKDYLAERSQQVNKHPQHAAILQTAQLALQNMTNPPAQQAICQWILQNGPQIEIAQAAAIAAGFAPGNLRQRAVFYFLTEQWAKYDEVDFDNRILRDYYSRNNSPAIRGPLNRRIRQSGQAKYLGILTSARTAEFTLLEAATLVDTLAAGQDWARLWELVFELPVEWSIKATCRLAESDWLPTAEYERELLARLKTLAQDKIVLTQDEFNQKFPVAILRTRVKVAGRVNCLAFSPVHPLIAIGTGNGKVALWNMQTARCEAVLNFKHSIGQLIYTPENLLICGERPATEVAPGNIYIWDGAELQQLGQHSRAITALAALPKNRLLSAGREGTVIMWDLATKGRLHEVTPFSDNWVRAIVSSNNTAIMLSKRARIYRTAFLENVDFQQYNLEGTATCAVLTPPDNQNKEFLITGRYSGGLISHVLTETNQLDALNGRTSDLAWNTPVDSPVQGLAILPHSKHLVAGSANGVIAITDLARYRPVGRLEVPGQRLIALTVSADGYTLATGGADASFSLWDLRPLELRQLYTLPLSQATTTHLTAIKIAEESRQDWPPEVKNSLRYIDTVLRQRFRYDIEIELMPEVHAGEFDIELSE